MEKRKLTGYEVLLIAVLTILQFSIVLDFMVISPLGAQLMRVLEINSSQFGAVVSAYAISAGVSGLLTAGFSDKFDRKTLLLFFYGGFIIGTLFCALAPNYELLFAARIFTGLFGGVMSSITFAIVTDVFSFEVRGRVMGFIQMAFSASQVLGIPVGLYLANKFGWHSPFFLIVGVSILVFILVWFKMKPINEHLKVKSKVKAIKHITGILTNSNYQKAFLTTFFLATGGFLIMPFSSAFLVYNVGVKETELPLIFMITGVGTIITGPLIGIVSDRVGKYKIFLIGTLLSIVMVFVYTNMNNTPLYQVIIINAIFLIFVSSRMIGSSAILTAVPEISDRGAFMNINSSIQQMSGGLATMLGGFVLIESETGGFKNFDTIGYLTAISMVICVILMYFINKIVMAKR
ncbi:MAG: MFS transporter [Thalassobius sp.]|nr:MFS transporter [Thalassovita sp.]